MRRAGRKLNVEMNRFVGNVLSASALAVAVVAAAACGGRGGKKAGEAPGEVRAFPQVSVPAMMESPEERAEYAALHYFDPFTKIEEAGVDGGTSRTAGVMPGKKSDGKFSGPGGSGKAADPLKYLCDSVHVAGVPSDQLEQAFASWCGLLDMVPLETAEKASEHLFDRIAACEAADTASNIFERMNEIADKYLYDPNSPLRNEDYYRPFVEARSRSELVSPEMRGTDAVTARNCSLNRVGTKAADFRFSDSRGHSYTLYGIKAAKTLLFFSNPGCNACKSIIESLKAYPEMEPMIASGELAVLNIYIDEDLAEWYNYMPIYPTSWYNGYDPDYAIRTDRLYDVRAIPSLYLLSRDKTVLMKDAPTEKVLPAIFGH